MRTTLISLLIGAVAGVGVTLTAIETTGVWYDYRMVHDADELPAYVNDRGWHIVPNQPNPLHIRRQRSLLH